MSLESSQRIDANIPPGFIPHDILLESSAEITTVAWSPDGQVLAFGSSDHTIHLWDQKTGRHLQTLRDYSHNIRKLVSGSQAKKPACRSRPRWDMIRQGVKLFYQMAH